MTMASGSSKGFIGEGRSSSCSGVAAVGSIRRSSVLFLPVVCFLVSFLAIFLAAAVARSEQMVRVDGLVARIHNSIDLAGAIQDVDGRSYLRVPGSDDVELLTGADDPRLPRTDVECFVPLSADVVAAALSSFHTASPRVACDIYLLPSPPVETLGSFARGNAIFLSPAMGAVPASAIAEVVTHEFGHVLTWVYFDRRPALWAEYRARRCLSEIDNGASAIHMWREREILAEDIRYLFGGFEATLHGGIENSEIALPDAVAGLDVFLRDSVSGDPGVAVPAVCTAFPNPCNPRTTIAMSIASVPVELDAATARLGVHDLRGRLVRTVRGGDLSDGRLEISWDGRDAAGRAAPSGRYFYRLTWGGMVGTGAVLLVR